MKKTHQVVMLPTTKSNNIGDIVLSPDSTRLATINVLTVDSKQPCTNQHLYITSDDEIKEGDWYVSDNGLEQSTILQAKKEYEGFYKGKQTCKKIVATTDKSIGYTDHRISPVPNFCDYPQIPESFIQAYINAYNEGKPITEVDLEMDCDHNQMPNKVIDIIKTRPDNTVIIHQSKTYSKDEIFFTITGFIHEHSVTNPKDFRKLDTNTIGQMALDWIKDNL